MRIAVVVILLVVALLPSTASAEQAPVTNGPFDTPAFWMEIYRLADGSTLTVFMREAPEIGGRCVVRIPFAECAGSSCQARAIIPAVLQQTPLCSRIGFERSRLRQSAWMIQ